MGHRERKGVSHVSPFLPCYALGLSSGNGVLAPGGQQTVATSSQEAPPNSENATVLSDDLVVGEPLTYQNLTVFPIA